MSRHSARFQAGTGDGRRWDGCRGDTATRRAIWRAGLAKQTQSSIEVGEANPTVLTLSGDRGYAPGPQATPRDCIQDSSVVVAVGRL
jgi:hypothetical protein